MSKKENEESANFLAYCKECNEKAPPDVKESLIPKIFTAASIFLKIFENIKASGLSIEFNELKEHCSEVSDVTCSANLLVGFGMAVEVVGLVAQFWRLKEFSQLLKKSSLIHATSIQKHQEIVEHLKEVKQQIKTFESMYADQGKTFTLDELLKMSNLKDDINDKLNDVKDCISEMKFEVGNNIEMLKMRKSWIMIDAVSGWLAGTLSISSSLIALSCINPWIAAGTITVSSLRILLGLVGVNKYYTAKTKIDQLQAEMNKILILGEIHKSYKKYFKNLCESICILPDGVIQLVIKE